MPWSTTSSQCVVSQVADTTIDHSIGVIYEGYQYPTFWTGYRTPTFQDTGEEFAVNRGDLRRLNYTKTIFGPTPVVGWRGDTPRSHVLLLNWYPHFLDQSYAPEPQTYPIAISLYCTTVHSFSCLHEHKNQHAWQHVG